MDSPGQSGPAAKKKKGDGTSPDPYCVVHFCDISHGAFKSFKDDKNSSSKFERLQEIKIRRQAESVTSPYRMQEQCNLLPAIQNDDHDYHWNYYKRFTGNLLRLQQQPEVAPESTSVQRTMRRSSSEKDSIIFQPDCIFCDSQKKKAVKVKGSWTTQNLSKFQSDGWKSVFDMAQRKSDDKLLKRIAGHDLFACEA